MITLEEYRSRRERLIQRLREAGEPDPVVVLQGAPAPAAHDRFRQYNDLMYLAPAEAPHAYLLVDGRGGQVVTTLYLASQSKESAETDGPHLSSSGVDTALAVTGVDRVKDLSEMGAALERVKVIFTAFRPGEGSRESWDTLQRARAGVFSDPWDGRVDRAARFVQLLRERYPSARVLDVSAHLDALRLVKSPAEVELLRRAGELSARGLVEAMRVTRPGAYEYQLDAASRFVYLDHGAFGESYRAIVGGGTNAWYGHYNANDGKLQDGDLVLFDCGPDYRYYASDITRMWPVNGRYTDEQRQLYGFMLAYHFALLKHLRPGITGEKVTELAKEEMEQVAARTDWLKPAYAKAARWSLDFPWHLSHPVGMAVHDVGHYRGGELREGVVLTVDPQMRVPEERLYLRVEDTVVITADGIENLTASAPYDMDEMEAVMREAPGAPLGAYRRAWED